MLVRISRLPHSVVVGLIITLAVFSMILQVARYFRVKKDDRTQEYKTLFWLELAAIIALLICCGLLVVVYYGYIPWDSPGYLSYVAPYGVIASNVDPTKYSISNPPVRYPALSYAEAIVRYRNSPDGLTTGLFSWDGLAVTILNPDAAHIADSPKGTSWVFQDLNTAVARAN